MNLTVSVPKLDSTSLHSLLVDGNNRPKGSPPPSLLMQIFRLDFFFSVGIIYIEENDSIVMLWRTWWYDWYLFFIFLFYRRWLCTWTTAMAQYTAAGAVTLVGGIICISLSDRCHRIPLCSSRSYSSPSHLHSLRQPVSLAEKHFDVLWVSYYNRILKSVSDNTQESIQVKQPSIYELDKQKQKTFWSKTKLVNNLPMYCKKMKAHSKRSCNGLLDVHT